MSASVLLSELDGWWLFLLYFLFDSVCWFTDVFHSFPIFILRSVRCSAWDRCAVQAKNLADQFNLDQLLEAKCFTGTRLWYTATGHGYGMLCAGSVLWYIDDFRMTKKMLNHINHIIISIDSKRPKYIQISQKCFSFLVDIWDRSSDHVRSLGFSVEFWSAGLETLLLGPIRGLRALHAIVGRGRRHESTDDTDVYRRKR